MTGDDTPDSGQLEAILADYLQRVEAGERVDRDAFLRQHPQCAEELAAFFKDDSQLKRLAASHSRQPDSDPASSHSHGRTNPACLEATLDSQSSGAKSAPLRLVGYFGDYELLGELARGGMGVVYKARQVSLNRVVALKMILAGQLASEQDVLRFRQEAEAAANLNHPGIVPIFEIGQHEGQHFFSMGFVEGESLAKLVAERPLAPRHAADLVRQVAEAVQYAHACGVVHRDLKPANVLLDRNGRPLVTDFGLAKKVEGQSELTTTGQILGTPGYMPPEQAIGLAEGIGPPADIYSLGAILYCMLTGRPPFQAANVLDTLMQVREQEPLAPRQVNPHVPRDLETICLKCLRKVPQQRYASAQLLADDLGRWRRGEPILARPTGQAERAWRWCRRNPVVACLMTTVAVLLVAGTTVSTALAIRASLAAEAEHIARQDAQRNETKAISLANDKIKLATKMTSLARDKTELARAEHAARVEQERLKKAAEKDRNAARHSLYLADVRQASQSLRNGEIGQVGQILSAHIPGVDAPDQRSWEWFYLLAQSQRQVRKLHGHRANVSRVRLSPDGRTLATADTEWPSTLRFWDAKTWQLLRVVSPQYQIFGLAWSPDSTRVAVGLTSGELQIYDASSGERTAEWASCADEPASGWVQNIAWSPDGASIATAACHLGDTRRCSIRKWDASTGRLLADYPGTSATSSCAWSPDGQLVAVTHFVTGVSILDAQAWKLSKYLPEECTSRQGGLDWSRDSMRLLWTCRHWQENKDGIMEWNRLSNTVRRVADHPTGLGDVDFNSDDARCVAAGEDRRAAIHDVASGKVLREFDGHFGYVQSVDWAPDDETIVTGAVDGMVGVWPLGAATDSSIAFSGHQGTVDSVAWSPNSQELFSVGYDGSVRKWDAVSGKELFSRQTGTPGLTAAAWSPGGAWLAHDALIPGERRQAVQLLSPQTGEPGGSFPAVAAILDLAFSPDGAHIAVGGHFAPVKILCVPGGEEVRTIEIPGKSAPKLAFSPDGLRLAVGEAYGHSSVWDVGSGKRTASLTGQPSSTSICWSGDGAKVAVGSRTAQISIHDSHTGEPLVALVGHRAFINSVAWNPAGPRIASGSSDGTVRIWDTDSGEEILRLAEHAGIVFDVAWSPDGRRLASCGEHGEIRVWNADAGYHTTAERSVPWWVAGPYPSDAAKSFGPETQIDPNQPVEQSPDQAIRWRRVTSGFDTKVDFRRIVGTSADNSCYAQTFVYSPVEQDVVAWLGHVGAARIWVNGLIVHDERQAALDYADARALRVRLRAGWNRLLARVWDRNGQQSLYLRLAAADAPGLPAGLWISHEIDASRLGEIDVPPPYQPAPVRPDRSVAEMVLRLNGVVVIEGQRIEALASLPEGDFTLSAVDWSAASDIPSFAVGRLTELEGLRDLTMGGIGDEAAPILNQVHSLRRLSLKGARCGDGVATTLAKSLHLESLDLTDTRVTAAGAEALRQELPKCDVLWNPREMDRQAAVTVLRLGGKVTVSAGSERLPLAVADELPAFPFRVVEVSLNDRPQVRDADLACLEELTELEILDLFRTGLTDDGMQHLRNLTSLQRLSIGKTKLTGTGLVHLANLTDLRIIDWGGGQPFTNEGLSHLPTLPNLVFWAGNLDAPLTDDALVNFQRLPALETLAIWWSHFSGEGIKHLAALRKLRHLVLVSPEIVDENLVHLQELPALKHLQLHYGPKLTDDGMRHIGRLRTVETLLLKDMGITDRGLEELKTLNQLTSLKVMGTKVTAAGIERLRTELPNCAIEFQDFPADRAAAEQILGLGGAVTILNVGTKSPIARLDDLPKYPFRLMQVSLKALPQVQDDHLACLAELAALESLELPGTGLTDDGMQHLRNLTKLQSLNLHSTNVTGRGLVHLAGLTELRNIYFGWGPPFTDEGLSNLPTLPNLVYWNGTLNAPVTDEALIHFQRLPALETLAIYRSSLTGVGIKHLKALLKLRYLVLVSDALVDDNLIHLQELPALKQLEFQFCPKLTDDGLRHIGGLQSLESLLLLEVPVTDRGLEELKTLKALTSLTVKGTKVTAEGIERLRAELPRCAIEWNLGQAEASSP